MSPQRKFYLTISSITLLAAAISYFVCQAMEGQEHMGVPLAILAMIFGTVTLVSGAFLFRYAEKRPAAFIRAFMGSFTLKFFINLILLAGYLYNFPHGRIAVTIVFFSLFLIFTIAEKVLVLNVFRS